MEKYALFSLTFQRGQTFWDIQKRIMDMQYGLEGAQWILVLYVIVVLWYVINTNFGCELHNVPDLAESFFFPSKANPFKVHPRSYLVNCLVLFFLGSVSNTFHYLWKLFLVFY